MDLEISVGPAAHFVLKLTIVNAAPAVMQPA